MNIILFFTYDISLKDWETSGLLDRELKFYESLNKKYSTKFKFITYGDHEDRNLINLPFIEIIPVYESIKYSKNKYIRFIKSFLIPYRFANELKDSEIIKTNQLLGSWVAIISKLKFEKKLIIRTGYDLVEFTKKNNKSSFKILVYSLLTKMSLRYCDLYLVSSMSDMSLVQRMSKKFKRKVHLRPNWVEISKNNSFDKRKENFAISVGRLEKQKNFSQLISFLENSNLNIDIYGAGTMKSKLINEAKIKNVKLSIYEPIPNKELLNKLKNYKFFISTSLFEGNPKAILEAMASGCVVLTKKNRNVEEIIKDNFNGIFIDDRDDLLNILGNLEDDPIKWSELSANSIETIENKYLLENIIDEEQFDYQKLSGTNDS
tara:strand:- start:2477 stop:3604 length:1128 start_codon:yes stop_codon:yes gene_type:complete